MSDVQEKKTNLLRAAYLSSFSGASGLVVLEDIGDILHFFSPAYTSEDMALQNAFKTILHRLGCWADDDQGRSDIIRKLRAG